MSGEGDEVPTASDSVASERPSGTQLKAEPPLPKGSACARCAAVIDDSYYELNGRATCPACRETLRGNMALATVAALASGIACTLVYYAIWRLWGVRFSLIAVVAGVVVGNVVRRFAGVTRRLVPRWVAVIITYLSIVATYVHSVLDQSPGDPLTEVLRSSLFLPFGMIYTGTNVVTLVLLAFGLHEAWQFSKAPNAHLVGPFRVADAEG